MVNLPELAGNLNRLRAIPRLMVAGYGYLLVDTHFWVKSLGEMSDTQQWYANIIWAGGAAVFGLYVNSGNNNA